MISDNFGSLRHLSVEYNKITEEGIDCLTDSKFFCNLTHFDIQQNEIGDIGAQILSTCVMKNLRFLNLKHNGIGEQGYRCLSESESMPLL